MNATAINRRLDRIEKELHPQKLKIAIAFQMDGYLEYKGACYPCRADLPINADTQLIIVHFVEAENGKPKKAEPQDYGTTFRGRLLAEASPPMDIL